MVSWLVLMLLFGCRSERVLLFTMPQSESYNGRLLPTPPATLPLMRNAQYLTDFVPAPRHAIQQARVSLRIIPLTATAHRAVAVPPATKALKRITGTRLHQQKARRWPVELQTSQPLDQIPKYFDQAATFALVGGLAFLVGLFTSWIVVVIGLVLIIIGVWFFLRN